MLIQLNDQALLSELSQLVTRERELLTQVLKYLLEVENRKLYLQRGFSSMFKFCVEYLNYSDSEAQVRIQAMRLIKSLPQVEEKIETGSLSLTNAAKIQNQFRKEASRRKDLSQKPLEISQKLEIVLELEKTSTRECERKLALVFPEIQQVEPIEKTKALRDEKTLIQFTANKQLIEKLEKLKGLLAHKNFSGRYDLLFTELADIALKKLDPELKPSRQPKALSYSERSNATPPGAHQVRPIRRSRYIASSIKRRAWFRAQGQCEYVDSVSGRACKSRHALEFDHKLAFAKGGSSTDENIQLLCDQHNRAKGSAGCG